MEKVKKISVNKVIGILFAAIVGCLVLCMIVLVFLEKPDQSGQATSTDTSSKRLLSQKISLPNGEIGYLSVSLSLEDSTYLISFETKDFTSLLRFYEEIHFMRGYQNYCDDSVLAHSTTLGISKYPRSFLVGEPGDYGWKPLKHRTTVDVFAKTELSNDKFQPIAKVEFTVDTYEHPKKIESIIIWETRQVYKNETKNK